MAQPSGSITPTDLGYTFSDVPEYVYIGNRIAQTINGLGWTTAAQRTWMRFRSCVSIDAACTCTIEYANNCAETRTGLSVREWSADWVETVINPEQGVGIADHGIPDLQDDLGTNPLTRIKRIKVFTEDKYYAVLHQVAIELYHTDPPLGDAEEFDRTDGANVLYQPNAPISSWMMMTQIGSYNWIQTQNRLLICISFFKPVYY